MAPIFRSLLTYLAREKLKRSTLLCIVMGMMFLVSSTSLQSVMAANPSAPLLQSVCPQPPAFPPGHPAGVPSDPNSFLTFLESYVVENDTTATAYYKAVDPRSRRLTLPDWLVVNGFITKPSDFPPFGTSNDTAVKRDAFAMYVNDVDLGVTRRFYSLTDGQGNVSIYTENYGCLADAKARRAPLATVAMEWRAADDGSNPLSRFTTFYAYGPDNKRILQINLDGRGDKAIPGNCQTCHGGKPRALDTTGAYPNHGNIGASFLPWDIKAFIFDTVDPALSRAAQEARIKKLSQAAYATYSKKLKFDEVAGYSRPSGLAELVEGWYGGPGLPSPTFIETFTPKGWLPPYAPANAQDLYQKVVVPTCRSCHISRERSLDFTSYRGFAVFRDATKELVFKVLTSNNQGTVVRPGDDRAAMPLALKTFNNFWTSNAPTLLRQHLDLMQVTARAATITDEQTDEQVDDQTSDQTDEQTSEQQNVLYLPTVLHQ